MEEADVITAKGFSTEFIKEFYPKNPFKTIFRRVLGLPPIPNIFDNVPERFDAEKISSTCIKLGMLVPNCELSSIRL